MKKSHFLSLSCAGEIMGESVFGIDEAGRHLGVKPSSGQLSALAEVPFSEDELRETKGSHILVADFGLSILDVRSLQPDLFSGERFLEESFISERGETRWQLVQKAAAKNSTKMSWSEQKQLVSDSGREEIPKARLIVYTATGRYLTTGGACLFEKPWVRCSDVISGGAHVYVGFEQSLIRFYAWNGYISHVGVAAARKISETRVTSSL